MKKIKRTNNNKIKVKYQKVPQGEAVLLASSTKKFENQEKQCKLNLIQINNHEVECGYC